MENNELNINKDSELNQDEMVNKLKALCDILTQENPCKESVHSMMMELNLPYTEDPISQLNTVFRALNNL